MDRFNRFSLFFNFDFFDFSYQFSNMTWFFTWDVNSQYCWNLNNVHDHTSSHQKFCITDILWSVCASRLCVFSKHNNLIFLLRRLVSLYTCKKNLFLLYGWINPIPHRKKCSSFQWKIKLEQFRYSWLLKFVGVHKIKRKRLFAGTLFQIGMFPVYWNSYLLRMVFDNSCWINYLWGLSCA